MDVDGIIQTRRSFSRFSDPKQPGNYTEHTWWMGLAVVFFVAFVYSPLPFLMRLKTDGRERERTTLRRAKTNF